jgi:hypothetical protein
VHRSGASRRGNANVCLNTGRVAGWLAITVSERALRPEWYAFKRVTRMFRMPRVFHRCRKIFFALALEFFLGGFEIGYACGDFFPLPSEAILRFSHAHPFFESCSTPIEVRDWGVN